MGDSFPITAGIVGCGANARSHGDAIEGNEGRIQLVACCDIHPKRAAAFAGRYDVSTTYTDHVTMVEEENLDLVILSTWPKQHEDQVLDCVAAGVRAILCEKSLTTSAESAARMARAADETNTLLVEGFKHRHHPRTLTLQQLVADGEIGELHRIRAGFHNVVNDETNWRRDPAVGGGVVYDFTCYCVNMLYAFTEAVPEHVSAEWTRREDGLIESLYATCRYPGDVIAEIDSSQRIDAFQPLELHGTDGFLSLDRVWNADQEDIILRKQNEVETYATEAANAFEEQLLHLCTCLSAGTTPRFTVDESVRNLAVIDAMLESAATNTYTAPDVPHGF